VIGAGERLAIFHLVKGQVFLADQATLFLDRARQLPGQGAVIKALWVLLDALQRASKFRLLKNLTSAEDHATRPPLRCSAQIPL
jgi:hypothetical protein